MTKELSMKSLLKSFRQQGGVITRTADGHIKLYKRVERPGQDPGYILIGKLSNAGKGKQSADNRGLMSVRASLRRNGFDV